MKFVKVPKDIQLNKKLDQFSKMLNNYSNIQYLYYMLKLGLIWILATTIWIKKFVNSELCTIIIIKVDELFENECCHKIKSVGIEVTNWEIFSYYND